MNATTAIKTYANVGLETSVTAADPHKLILLLYQGALLAISSAKNHMLRKEAAAKEKSISSNSVMIKENMAKGKSISHAIMIIDEGLKASLDKNAGGEMAQNLSALYDYMGQRLLIANLKNDVTALDEVSRLLTELKEAWEEIRPAVMSAQPEAATRPQTTLAKPAALTYGRV